MQYLKCVQIPNRGSSKIHGNQKDLKEPNDYSAVTRNPSNVWTPNQKIILAWLAASTKNNWKQVTEIFNCCFGDELPTKMGLSVGAITSMWRSMDLTPDEMAAIKGIQVAPTYSQSISFEAVTRTLLSNIACNLKIPLSQDVSKLSLLSNGAIRPKLSRKRKADNIQESTSESSGMVDLESDSERICTGMPHTPKKSYTRHPANPYPTPTSPRPEKQPASSQLPRLGFRAFSEQSHGINDAVAGFVAGAFVSLHR